MKSESVTIEMKATKQYFPETRVTYNLAMNVPRD